MKPYRKIRTKDSDLSRVQDRVADTFTTVLQNAIIDGTFVDVVFSGAGTVEVNHLLSRQPLGWIIVDITTACQVHRDSWDARTLTLTSDAATTVKLYVF